MLSSGKYGSKSVQFQNSKQSETTFDDIETGTDTFQQTSLSSLVDFRLMGLSL